MSGITQQPTATRMLRRRSSISNNVQPGSTGAAASKYNSPRPGAGHVAIGSRSPKLSSSIHHQQQQAHARLGRRRLTRPQCRPSTLLFYIFMILSSIYIYRSLFSSSAASRKHALSATTAAIFKFCPLSTQSKHVPTAILIGDCTQPPDGNRTSFGQAHAAFLPLADPHRDKRFAQDLQGGLGGSQKAKPGQGRLHLKDDAREEGVQRCPAFIVPSSPPISDQTSYYHQRGWRHSKVMFGVSANADAVLKALPVWDHWLPKSKHALDPMSDAAKAVPLVLVLTAPPNPTERSRMTEAVEEAQARGMHVDMRKRAADKPDSRYFGLVQELWKEANKRQERENIVTEWFIIIDDDTFFPDYEAVVRMLAEHDSSKDLLIGAESVSRKQVRDWGHVAYGGAGIFISRSLMSKMADKWEDCHTALSASYTGDAMISYCAARVLGKSTPSDVITIEPTLHQLDIRGDATGWFQSGFRLTSVQHWSSWYSLFPPWHPSGEGDLRKGIRMLGRAAVGVGGDNWGRRYAFDGGKVVVVLGYSVTIYDQPVSKSDMTQTEHTWWQYETFHPLREALEEGVQKRTYYLTGARLIEQGVTRIEHRNREGEKVDIVFDNRAGMRGAKRKGALGLPTALGFRAGGTTGGRLLSNAKGMLGV